MEAEVHVCIEEGQYRNTLHRPKLHLFLIPAEKLRLFSSFARARDGHILFFYSGIGEALVWISFLHCLWGTGDKRHRTHLTLLGFGCQQGWDTLCSSPASTRFGPTPI